LNKLCVGAKICAIFIPQENINNTKELKMSLVPTVKKSDNLPFFGSFLVVKFYGVYFGKN
tara:strand:- start:289 stop:468 length:180 start_codon:yes stop_codon:yes gene_type:complete